MNYPIICIYWPNEYKAYLKKTPELVEILPCIKNTKRKKKIKIFKTHYNTDIWKYLHNENDYAYLEWRENKLLWEQYYLDGHRLSQKEWKNLTKNIRFNEKLKDIL